MCVKPFPLEDKKPFRIGPTEARSTDEGAAGSMSIPAPPGLSKVTRFRIAGELNEGIIRVQFYRCGWDPDEKDHEKTSLLKKPLEFSPSKAYEHTWPPVDSPERLRVWWQTRCAVSRPVGRHRSHQEDLDLTAGGGIQI